MRGHGPPPDNQRDPAHDPAAAAPDSTCTFGDTDVEAARLAPVTKIFGPTSQELLTQAVEDPRCSPTTSAAGRAHGRAS